MTDVHENVQCAKCLTHCTFTCTRQILGSLHVYMHLVSACKRAVIRLSDVFNNWAVSSMTDVSQLSDSLHIYMDTSDSTGHCTFTCTLCVHACKRAVIRLSDVFL